MEGVGEERLGAGKPVSAMHPIVHTDNREIAISKQGSKDQVGTLPPRPQYERDGGG